MIFDSVVVVQLYLKPNEDNISMNEKYISEKSVLFFLVVKYKNNLSFGHIAIFLR